MMKTAHRIVGFIFVIVFVLTGAYMRFQFPSAYHGDSGMRMMFRSAHIYILFSALLNLLLGAYMLQRYAKWKRILNGLGSLFILISPSLFTVAFFVEPAAGGQLNRSIAPWSVILALLGSIFHTITSYETVSKGQMNERNEKEELFS